RVPYSNYRVYGGTPARSGPGRRDRSGRHSGSLHAACRQQLSEFAGFEHLADDIATADELAFDIELRNRWPVGECLDSMAERRIAEHVDTLELDAQMAQHLDHGTGKIALREDLCTFHEQHDIMLADLALDALLYWIRHCFDLLSGTVGVVVCAEKMQGNIGLVADHPAVVSGRDVEDISLAHLGDGAIVHCRCCPARDDDADMLNRATRRADSRPDMQRPFPAGLIGRAANRHT